ncbi:hypothetical protein IL306_011644 [Fusarium sp. DS 682]|nr:hypothetical protein IL306_011644 [Fusarium sp. DS 682]
MGLVQELYCKLDYNNEEREVGLITNFQRFARDPGEDLGAYWKFHRPQAEIHIRDFVQFQQTLLASEEEKNGNVTNYMIAGGWLQGLGHSVHENITLASLIQAGLIPSGMTYRDVVGWTISVNKPEIFEFIRGVIWNDDPACYLFNDKEHNNGNFGLGVDWFFDFKIKWKFFQTNIIWRSHFGDLQFLHAMGTKKGEKGDSYPHNRWCV